MESEEIKVCGGNKGLNLRCVHIILQIPYKTGAQFTTGGLLIFFYSLWRDLLRCTNNPNKTAPITKCAEVVDDGDDTVISLTSILSQSMMVLSL